MKCKPVYILAILGYPIGQRFTVKGRTKHLKLGL